MKQRKFSLVRVLTAFVVTLALLGSGLVLQITAAPAVVTEPPIYAADSLTAAVTANSTKANTGESITWAAGQWRAQYCASNSGTVNGGWYDMKLYATDTNMFSRAGTNLTQPTVQAKKKEGKGDFKVELNANNFASTSWWTKAGVAFTATEAGDYTISCDTMEPGRLWSSSASAFVDSLNGTDGDGHVIVTKNNVKIWPVEDDYASVTSANHPTIEALQVTLAVGDTIRFEGFGGKVGEDTPALANPNGSSNNIYLNPAIAKVKPAGAPAIEGVEQIDPTTVYTKPAVTAAAQTKKAATDFSDDKIGLNWGNYSWKFVYTNSNFGMTGWTNMSLADGASGSFSYTGTVGNIPYALTDGDQVILNANQWGDGTWWDIAGVQYVAPEAADYLLTCPILTPGSDAFDAASAKEGRVIVTRNGEKIWPADADYASITQSEYPSFLPLKVTLAKGDVLRFEAYGALIEGENKANGAPRDKNRITLSPAIAQIVDEPWTGGDDSDSNDTSDNTPTRPQNPKPEMQNLKVLFLGNSATEVNNVPAMFQAIAQKAGYTVTVDSVTWGGCTFARYADPDDDAGQAFRAKLNTGDFDIVFLQENSSCISSPAAGEETAAAAADLAELIRDAGAKPYFYTRGPVKSGALEKCDLTSALFDSISEELNIPSADHALAIKLMLTENPDYNFWGADNAHFNREGSFLAALVCFAELYQETTENIYQAGLEYDVAHKLQQIADLAVFGANNDDNSDDSDQSTDTSNDSDPSDSKPNDDVSKDDSANKDDTQSDNTSAPNADTGHASGLGMGLLGLISAGACGGLTIYKKRKDHAK